MQQPPVSLAPVLSTVLALVALGAPVAADANNDPPLGELVVPWPTVDPTPIVDPAPALDPWLCAPATDSNFMDYIDTRDRTEPPPLVWDHPDVVAAAYDALDELDEWLAEPEPSPRPEPIHLDVDGREVAVRAMTRHDWEYDWHSYDPCGQISNRWGTTWPWNGEWTAVLILDWDAPTSGSEWPAYKFLMPPEAFDEDRYVPEEHVLPPRELDIEGR